MSYLDVAQKQLRTELNLHINIRHKPWSGKFGYDVTGTYHTSPPGGTIIPYNFKDYDTYEDAQRAALKEVSNYVNNDKSGEV